jgi:hypothetical protein
MERITEKRRPYNTFFTVNERKKCVGKVNTVPFVSISHMEHKSSKSVKVDDIKIYLNGTIKFANLWSFYQYYREGGEDFLCVVQKLIDFAALARNCIKSDVYYNHMKDDAFDVLQNFLPEKIHTITTSDLKVISDIDNITVNNESTVYKMVTNKDPYETNEVYGNLSLDKSFESSIDEMSPFLKVSKYGENNFVKYTILRDGGIIFHDKKTKFDIMGGSSDMAWLLEVSTEINDMGGITPDSIKAFPNFDNYITAELRVFPDYV